MYEDTLSANLTFFATVGIILYQNHFKADSFKNFGMMMQKVICTPIKIRLFCAFCTVGIIDTVIILEVTEQ